MPAWQFEQEYYCRFHSTEFGAFAPADIDTLVSGDVAPLFPIRQEVA